MMLAMANFCIWITGWKVVGNPVPGPKGVVACAYHTSNWDAFYCLVFNVALKKRVSWLGKESLFWWPLGPLLKLLGGVAIRRDGNRDFVSRIVEEFKRRDYLVLAIAPEGTRKKISKWKTGFYFIARNAGVPLQLLAFDYENKALVFSDPMTFTANPLEDLNYIREFFRPFKPKYPDRADPDFLVDLPAAT
jgi:1-acyl-sn-glycerol-3-phosphate acyltransferase